MTFDPSKYLAEKTGGQTGFDPSKYLAEKTGEQAGSEWESDTPMPASGLLNRKPRVKPHQRAYAAGYGALTGLAGGAGDIESMFTSANPAQSPALRGHETVFPTSSEVGQGLQKLGLPKPKEGTENWQTAGQLALVAPAIPALARGATAGYGALSAKAKQGVAALRGAEIPAAQNVAKSAAQKAVASGESTLASQIDRESRIATGFEKRAAERHAELEKAMTVDTPSLSTQGAYARSTYETTIEAAVKARREAYAELIPKAMAEAAVKESAGEVVRISPAVVPLKRLAKLAEDTPLEGKLEGLIDAIEGSRKGKGQVSPIVSQFGAPLRSEGAAAVPKTFEQLEQTTKMLKDIAYSSPMEGYSAIIKKAARDAAGALDASLAEFAPTYGKAKATYAKMSEPIESVNTRLGRALRGTEGGLQEKAYNKIADQDLPGKLFAKKEGIELMVDAFAGGAKATKESRKAAQLKVDGMVEKWLLESMRGKTGAQSADKLAQMRSTLEGAPAVGAKLTARAKGLAQKEADLRTASEQAAAARSSRAARMRAQDTVRIAREEGDSLSRLPDKVSQKKALDAYMRAIEAGRRSGVVSADEMRTVHELISRKNTLEEKMKSAQKVASYLKVAGAIGAEETIRRTLF